MFYILKKYPIMDIKDCHFSFKFTVEHLHPNDLNGAKVKCVVSKINISSSSNLDFNKIVIFNLDDLENNFEDELSIEHINQMIDKHLTQEEIVIMTKCDVVKSMHEALYKFLFDEGLL